MKKIAVSPVFVLMIAGLMQMAPSVFAHEGAGDPPATNAPGLMNPAGTNAARTGTNAVRRGGGRGPTARKPNTPDSPLLIPAGPDAEALAKAAWPKPQVIVTETMFTNENLAAMKALRGANPPADVDGDFLIGPEYVHPPETVASSEVPHGRIETFTINSADSKIYPGIGRNQPAGTAVPYQRQVKVYIPAQYKAGTPAPFIVAQDGNWEGTTLMTVLDNMIAQHRLPVMLAVSIYNGGGDGQGSERGLEYDTMSGLYAEFVETEVLPVIEQKYNVKFTKDPEGRATMGGSSGGSAAFSMAWYHPELYHRVLTYSGTYVNQQSPLDPKTPHGAWEYHEHLIPQSETKPLRVWLQASDRDNQGRADGYHDWVKANQNMAIALRAKGYHYQYVFALNAGHTDGPVKVQTLPEALEWLWQGYPNGN